MIGSTVLSVALSTTLCEVGYKLYGSVWLTNFHVAMNLFNRIAISFPPGHRVLNLFTGWDQASEGRGLCWCVLAIR